MLVSGVINLLLTFMMVLDQYFLTYFLVYILNLALDQSWICRIEFHVILFLKDVILCFNLDKSLV